MNTEKLRIEGMSCDHCVHAVKQALEDTPGVEVKDVKIGSAEIAYDPSEVTLETIQSTLAEEGYTVVGNG